MVGIPVFIATFFVVRFGVSQFTDGKAPLLMIPQFAGQAAMLIPLAMAFRVKYERGLLDALRLGVTSRQVVVSLGAGLALAFAVLLIAAALRTPEIPSPMQDLMNDPQSARWVAVFAVFVGPVFEEILFRGLLQPVAIRTLGLRLGIVLSALPFSLLHGPQYAWSWRHVLMILLAGSAFGWWRVRTQSTGASSVMHASYNAILAFGYLLGKSSF